MQCPVTSKLCAKIGKLRRCIATFVTFCENDTLNNIYDKSDGIAGVNTSLEQDIPSMRIPLEVSQIKGRLFDA